MKRGNFMNIYLICTILATISPFGANDMQRNYDHTMEQCKTVLTEKKNEEHARSIAKDDYSLLIPNKVEVRCHDTGNNAYQEYINMENMADLYTYNYWEKYAPDTYGKCKVIADHNNQNFSGLFSVNYDDTLYLTNKQNNTTKYKVYDIIYNTKWINKRIYAEDDSFWYRDWPTMLDKKNRSVFRYDENYIVTYTCIDDVNRLAIVWKKK